MSRQAKASQLEAVHSCMQPAAVQPHRTLQVLEPRALVYWPGGQGSQLSWAVALLKVPTGQREYPMEAGMLTKVPAGACLQAGSADDVASVGL